MLINIRGPNGSGKTHLVRSLFDKGRDQIQLTETVSGYETGYGIVVGRYETACGGMDTVKTQAAAKEAVTAALARRPTRHVVFEGILISTIYKPWLDFFRNCEATAIWAFLDTPVEVCLERIYARNGGKKIKEELVHDKWRGIDRVRRKALAAGQRVEVLNYEQAEEQLKCLLQ